MFLLYQNDNSAPVAQRIFRNLKVIQKCLLIEKSLRIMITKFEEKKKKTGCLMFVQEEKENLFQ